MSPDELRDLMIRLDERTARMDKADQDRILVVDKRLDSHADAIKKLNAWRNWMAGAQAVIGLALAHLGLNKQ